MNMHEGAKRAAALKPFTAGGNAYGMPNLRGGAYEGRTGMLPEQYHDSVRTADYVVYSYATPIAWHTAEGWVKPSVKYSLSTTRHQSTMWAL